MGSKSTWAKEEDSGSKGNDLVLVAAMMLSLVLCGESDRAALKRFKYPRNATETNESECVGDEDGRNS